MTLTLNDYELPEAVCWQEAERFGAGTAAALWDRPRGEPPIFAMPGSAWSMSREMVNSGSVTSGAIDLTHPHLTLSVEDDPGVAAFCNRLGLAIYVRRALDSVSQHFSPARPIKVSVKQDPEFPDEWLELDVTAAGNPDEVSAAIDRCTSDWLAVAPPHLWSRVRVCVGLG